MTPGGLWDANKYDVGALIKSDGRVSDKLALKYGGSPSMFSAELVIRRPAAYQVSVYIHDKLTGNTGVGRSTFIVSAA